jgi:hypothetical protein
MHRTEISIAGYQVIASSGEWPELYASYRTNAQLVEEFDLSSSDGETSFFAITAGHRSWPQLVISQRYEPSGYGFHPGLLIVPETSVVFVGAGSRLLAYRMTPEPHRLWEDETFMGFWSWEAHEGTILMSAEMELAAWNSHGEKLWTTPVDPPWHYTLEPGRMTLNVTGDERSFPLPGGPVAG